MEGANVRMIELRNDSRFALESKLEIRVLREFGPQEFDRHGAAKAGIARLVDFTHPSGANRIDNLVGAKMVTRPQRTSRQSIPHRMKGARRNRRVH